MHLIVFKNTSEDSLIDLLLTSDWLRFVSNWEQHIHQHVISHCLKEEVFQLSRSVSSLEVLDICIYRTYRHGSLCIGGRFVRMQQYGMALRLQIDWSVSVPNPGF